jgi:hypothetical protein
MEQRSRPFRLLLIPPLVAMGLAGGIAYLLSGDAPTPAPSEPAAEPEPAAAPAPSAKPVAPAPAPIAQQKLVPAPAPATPAPAAPALEQPEAGHAQAMMERLKEPKMREHAQLMVVEGAKMALKNGDLPQLQKLRTTIRQEGIEQVIAAGDLTAIDIGIECLARTADAKARAFEFLEDNPSSPMAESLRAACH